MEVKTKYEVGDTAYRIFGHRTKDAWEKCKCCSTIRVKPNSICYKIYKVKITSIESIFFHLGKPITNYDIKFLNGDKGLLCDSDLYRTKKEAQSKIQAYKSKAKRKE
jgi:hypothetical protein